MRFNWLFVCLLAPAVGIYGGEPDFTPIENAALAELKALNTPGAAVAVVKGDRIVYAKGFGFASIETKAPVQSEMLFRLGSTTKMFVGVAMCKLEEQGKIQFHEPISKYVAGLPPKIGRLTIHQCLTHTAGLTDESPMHGLHDDSALANGVRSLKEDFFFTEPGKIYSYSNAGYWIAGLVLEEVTKKPFADAMEELVFRPLGMQRTTFRPLVAMTYPLAIGHDGTPAKVTRPIGDNVATWPAGQMFSNVHEFARWTIALMNGGQLEGKQVLSPSLIEKLTTGYVDTPHNGGKYGYGIGLRTTHGVDFLGHGGSRLGYGSSLTLAVKEKVAVIVLANKTGVSLPKTTNKALEVVLGKPPLAAQDKLKDETFTKAEATALAGTYTNNRVTIRLVAKDDGLRTGGGDVVMKRGDNQLRVATGKGPAQDWVLVRVGQDTFLLRQGRALRKTD